MVKAKAEQNGKIGKALKHFTYRYIYICISSRTISFLFLIYTVMCVCVCLLVFKSNVKHIINISDFHSNNISFLYINTYICIAQHIGMTCIVFFLFIIIIQMKYYWVFCVCVFVEKSTISNKFFNLLPFLLSKMTSYIKLLWKLVILQKYKKKNDTARDRIGGFLSYLTKWMQCTYHIH